MLKLHIEEKKRGAEKNICKVYDNKVNENEWKRLRFQSCTTEKGASFFLLLILLQCCHLLSWIAIECVSMEWRENPHQIVQYILHTSYCWYFVLLCGNFYYYYFFFVWQKRSTIYSDLNHIIVIVISVYRHWLYVIVIHGEYDGDMR